MFIRMQFALRTSLQCRNISLNMGTPVSLAKAERTMGKSETVAFPTASCRRYVKDDLQGTDPVFMFYMQRTSLIMLSKKDSKIFRRYDDRDSRSR